MFEYVYEVVTPTPIENATVKRVIRDGVFMNHQITPNEGYVLHDNGRDEEYYDPELDDTVLLVGYTRGTASCGANYDFTANPRGFYAVLESEVPADRIFGGGNDHEVM